MGHSTNTVRGVLTIRSKTNAAIRHAYNVTGSVVDGTGYRKLTLAYVSGAGALTNGAAYWLIFDRIGDAGEVTLAGTQTAQQQDTDHALNHRQRARYQYGRGRSRRP